MSSFAAALLLGCGGGGPSVDDGGSPDDPNASGVAMTVGGDVQEVGQEHVGSVDAPPNNRAWVIFGADTVVVEVAATPEQRERGLMYREELPEGTGMLFVFQDSQERSFWMANTYIPLDIAYMDAKYTIVSILAMEPLDRNLYPSGAPAMYALEVPQGWFESRGIEVGDRPEIVF